MGYLALLVASIPRWISYGTEKAVIDFATYDHFIPKTTTDLLRHFDENIAEARRVLQHVTNEQLEELFYLKREGKTLYSTSKKENIWSCINHWVHHRGQLTVYMRMNSIPVPSIYGPSADENTFTP